MNGGKPWTLLLPGSIHSKTGGTIYDARMALGSRDAGCEVDVVELGGGRYPWPHQEDRDEADALLRSVAPGRQVIVDGLCLGALPEQAIQHSGRLRIVALVHHPLCDETGLSPAARDHLFDSERRALSAVVGVICTSDFTVGRLRQLELVPEGMTIHVVEPGVDRAELSAVHAPGESIEFLSVGSLTPRKALADAATALSQMPSQRRWRWTIAGRHDLDPTHAEELRALVNGLGIGDRTSFLGQVHDALLDGLYRSSHALLHPAHYEGYGMVITEALARGLPVVCSSGGALRSTLPKGAGLTYAPGDTAALTGLLDEILRPSGTLAQLRLGALDARQQLIGWKEALSTWERARAALR